MKNAYYQEYPPSLRLAGANVVLAERKTFYGMREILIREPGGNLVLFACPVAK